MIVNVNPYDTGFDENSQVMKFSAIAREVSTISAKPQPLERRRTVRLSFADESYDALFDILEGELVVGRNFVHLKVLKSRNRR